MKKLIKAIGCIGIIGIVSFSSYMFGFKKTKTVIKVKVIEVVPNGYIDTNSNEFLNNYVDMRKVVGWEANRNNGLQLYCEDGSGYYLE